MTVYKLKTVTGTDLAAGTCNIVSIVLVGVNGESDKHQLPHNWWNFIAGAVTEFDIPVNKDLGELLLVRLSMDRYLNFPLDPWYCRYVTVTFPKGHLYQFPLHQWILNSVEIPEGKGVVMTDSTHAAVRQQRKLELDRNKETHKWRVYAEGVPRCFDLLNDNPQNLPPNDQFSFRREASFQYASYSTGLEVKLNGYIFNTDSWHILEDIKIVSSLHKSQYSDIVSKMWKEDSFFGSQYLNGVNPTLIKKCVKIPEKFPVTEHMVAPSLGTSTNLQKELQNGHIFLADYEVLQGVPANNINGKQQYITAPMCLLWKNPKDELVPIAIQLAQSPGENVPIFLPSDSEHDWILAKIWVRSADFQAHEVDTHLLRTHFLAEVFSIATTRQLPMGHPVHKLIIPHFRFTLEINTFARQKLLGKDGPFDQASVTGNGGVPVLLKNSMAEVTYSSLCLPDYIKIRGMESIPNYLYRDDGLEIWSAVESFVSDIINYYYTCDEMVRDDTELQAWVEEIFSEGFLQNKSSGVPSSLGTKESLIRYLTMVIFTCSAQHAAVNTGQVTEFNIPVNKNLGELLLVRLSMERYLNFPLDPWYCRYVTVTCPKGHLYQFPLHQWILNSVEIPEGKGVVITKNTHPAVQQQRKLELEMNRETHKWKVYEEGVPHCIDVVNDDPQNLTPNDQYSFQKQISFGLSSTSTDLEAKLNGYSFNTDSWHILEDIKIVSSLRKSQYSDIVSKIWEEDAFFGNQYLNGVNPILIKKCIKIPENFPVTEYMVAPSLGSSTNLQKELQKGRIFVADYEVLQGVPANNLNGKQQYITAPMCLLWKNSQDELVPIAIQLSQLPGENIPIFLPSDLPYDWLLAKIWVRSADFQVHEVDTHLLRTHLLAEVFSIATTRQLPMGHPVHKLIIPHLRYILQINVIGRKHLTGPDGIFDQALVTGNGGLLVLLKKSMAKVTYSSLCLPEDIKIRGMESITNYLYRDDGLKIWAAVESFVSDIIHYYYASDEMVGKDPELQAWVAEIFKEGFLQNESSGVPSSLETKASLIRYLTMVIFMCSAQHAAVNSGQYDFYSWMPNAPPTMKIPPPTIKGVTTMETILETLPDVNITTFGINAVWVLSNDQTDKRPLGHYPDERFTEETPQQFIKKFQHELSEISKCIQERNKAMRLPYPYLNPSEIENSISI